MTLEVFSNLNDSIIQRGIRLYAIYDRILQLKKKIRNHSCFEILTTAIDKVQGKC